MARKISDPEIRIALHKHLLDNGSVQSCLNCDNWNTKHEICHVFKQRPPAKVIVISCGDNWQREIPF